MVATEADPRVAGRPALDLTRAPALVSLGVLEVAAGCVCLKSFRIPYISPFTDTDRNDYYSGVEALAKQHGEPYQEVSGLDDVVTLQEMAAKVDAAHMVGLALGLRLVGRHGLGGTR